MGFVWVEDKEDDKRFKKHVEDTISTATTTLTQTNKGLLSDIKSLKKKVKEKEDINIDEFNRLKTENEDLKSKKKKKETDAEKQLRLAREQHKAEVDDLKKRLNKMDERDKNNLAEKEIAKTLRKINVKDTLFDAASKMIRLDVTFEDDGEGNVTPMIGDKTIKQYIKKWRKTPEGKSFIKAPKNNGGDAKGNKNISNETNYDKYFDKKSGHHNLTKQIELKKKNEKLYSKLLKKYTN